MLSFVVFVFVGVGWDTSGMTTPTLQFEITRAACEFDRATWLAEQEKENDGRTPAFRVGFGATPCIMLISQSGAKQS